MGGRMTKERFANTSKIDGELDDAGKRVEANFDSARYLKKTQDYAKFATRASEKATEAKAATNVSDAEDKLNMSEIALEDMTKVGKELDALESDLHTKLHSALAAKLEPELSSVAAFGKNASKLQHTAHKMMDPLYGAGDAAQDKADDFNDETNDALSKVDKVLRKYRHHIMHHARDVHRQVDRKLIVDQDREATWRRVNRLVRQASWHVHGLEQPAALSSLELGSLGSMTLFVSIAAAIMAASALTVHFAMKHMDTRSGDYHLIQV